VLDAELDEEEEEFADEVVEKVDEDHLIYL
jgi:hypothetical protein